MSKKRKNITIDEDIDEAIPDNGEFSSKVNQWARQYYKQNSTQAVEGAMAQEMRNSLNVLREHLHDAIDEAIDNAQNELDETIEHLDIEPEDQTDVSDVLEELATIHQSQRNPENPAIKKRARQVDIEPNQLIERLNEEFPTDRFGEPQDSYFSDGEVIA